MHGTLHGVRSKKSQIHRHTLGRFKKAVSTKQDDRTRQSHKCKLKSTYTKAANKEYTWQAGKSAQDRTLDPK